MTGIRKLAKELGLSIGTVSRALNGKADVNKKTRQRVLEAAAAMGYVPNQAGRALRKGSTGVIGFMMQTSREITSEGDVFFMSVFDGVQAVLARHRLDLVALLCSSEEDPQAYLQRMVVRGFADGLIISATQRHDARISYLAGRKIPFTTLGRSLTDAGQPWLDLDFEDMARVAVNRLVSRGHRRIGLLAPHNEINLGFLLIDSYRQTLAENGIDFDPDLILRACSNERNGYDIARRISALPAALRPTGFILVDEKMTVGFYRGLREAGLVPGRDMAIIGRNSPHAQYLNPKLTGFQISLRDLGVTLAESLLAIMPEFAAHYQSGIVRKVLPLDLVEGESDGSPR